MNKGRTKDAALRRLTRGVINRASRLPQPIDYEAVLDLDELDKLFEYLASIDLAQFGVTDGGKPVPASKPHLLRFYIAPALAIMQSNGVRFDEVYGELEDSFYVDSSTWINLAPLMNFKATSAPVNVTEGTNIRRLTTTEVHNISRYWPGPWGPTEPPKFGVEVTVSRPKAAPYGDSEATTRLEETLAALRLVKPGSVAYGQMARGEEMVYIQWIVGPSFGTLAMGNPGFQTGMAGYSNPPLNRYVLYKDDIPRLREIASNIGTAQAVQSLKNAIVRLGLALQRFKPEDALIDYWVGIEGTLLPDISVELRYRSALRVAYLLGRNPSQRQILYNRTIQSYDARSWLVHGEQPSKKRFDFGRIATETGDTLRKVLQMAVLYPGEPDLDRLDSTIAAGGRYEPKKS